MLLALKFVGAMGIANGDGERIDMSGLDKFHRLLGVGIDAAGAVMAALLAFIKLGADQLAEFAFDNAIMFMSVIDDFFAKFCVFFEGIMAAIDHHAGKAFVDAFLAEFERIAMVQMDRDGDVGEADGGL